MSGITTGMTRHQEGSSHRRRRAYASMIRLVAGCFVSC